MEPRGITADWLEVLGFDRDPQRKEAWRLWCPDQCGRAADVYLRLSPPAFAGGCIWAADLYLADQPDRPVPIPRPIASRGTVLFLITAVGGRAFDAKVLEESVTPLKLLRVQS